MRADIHAHFPMHLLTPGEADTHAAVVKPWPGSAWRGLALDALSRLANYQGPRGAPGVTVELMRQGDVGVALSVLYVPLDEMDLDERYGAPPRSKYVASIRDQMDRVEAALEREAALDRASLVRSPGELDAALDAGQIAFIHCIEGGFALGATEEEVAATVAEFAQRGVAYITLAHLFYRGVATNAPALPFMPDPLYNAVFPQPDGPGLTALGEAAIRAMVEHGVLVDITHMDQRAIDRTFRTLDALPRPVPPPIASHIACRVGRAEYNLADDVIAKIGRRGGIIGVIACEHWAGDGLRKAKDFDASVSIIAEHIDRICDVTGSDEHAAIGTDLDGYIKPALPGLEHEGRMKALADALTARYGRTRAEKFCSGNALALLRRHWRAGRV
jgi:microsomal dipeptidase-like Zn-dependent dipeptidase